MLEGQTVVFLSCMDAFADQLARPIRDQLNELGYRAIIVTDEPLLRGSFDAESKVSAYIEASDTFVALCTQDDRVPGSTAQNIIDEIGRARSHPSLREVVCVLKEANVKLPSNINPVWNALEADRPDAAFGVIRRQLEAWGVVPTVPRSVPTGTARLPTAFLDDLFEGVGIGDHDKAEAKLRVLFGRTTKSDQGRVVEGIFDYAMSLPEDGADIHIVTSFLEAAARVDLTLVDMAWIEQLTMSGITQHRMSAAMMLWDLAVTVPGIVPLDLVAKLAKPATEDWYVFAPALGAAKQLALTRKSALDIILDLARSLKADDRDYAVAALGDLARVDPALIPIKPVERLARDTDSSVAKRATALLETLRGVTDAERNTRYGLFAL
jgi:uncharacterized protein YozE (UPF0346 family)